MADQQTDVEPYWESEDHVPDPTHVTEQLDTTGTGGPSDVRSITPIFDRAAQTAVVEAAEAVRSEDQRRLGTVVLPEDPASRETATRDLMDQADTLRGQGVRSPSELHRPGFGGASATQPVERSGYEQADPTTQSDEGGAAQESQVEDTERYDPSRASVSEVQAYLDAHPEQATKVKAEERAGKRRSGVLDYQPRHQAGS